MGTGKTRSRMRAAAVLPSRAPPTTVEGARGWTESSTRIRPGQKAKVQGSHLALSMSCLIVQPHLASKLQHVSEAKVKSWAFLEEPKLDDEIREIIAELAEDPLSVSQSTKDVIAKWAKRAQELEPARDLFRRGLPPHLHCTVGKIHVPLLRELLQAAGHKHDSFLEDLTHGFPVVGEMSAGGIGRAVDGGVKRGGKPAHGLVPCMDEFRGRCRENNLRTIARARVDAHSAEVCSKTKKEIAKGQVRELRRWQRWTSPKSC